ncbi:CHASE2 and HATPase_c domain-containing protein [Halomonas sabkhae]|uniref:CHASE2 and HATPase_c domain-containing protein n=1 Tax=Halomonas sabkhae TaxID=626223 RepID=UPI0025B2E344|nr:CHASE2 and HATPase_c domain-containing protein [Halomonas sabkhae]MDN3524560.1 CHASE2 and HATPase_c domain-containing protein [Halomonas sabkhae]
MHQASHSLFRDLTRTWLLIGLVLLAATWWAGQQHWMADHELYDRLLTRQDFATDDDILIAAIDERSLEALGRWPWSRDVHARFLDQLDGMNVNAVLFDVVFAEAASGSQDQRLAAALERYGHAFLPVIHDSSPGRLSASTYLPPITPLREAARGMGHINIRSDRDGIVRHVALYRDDIPQLTLRLYQHLASRGLVSPEGATESLLEQDTRPDVRIPYRAGALHYPRVSYVDILQGRIPPSLLEERIVMIGATANGLGDRHPTPFGGDGGGMPGVEIQANLLNGLLNGDIIREPPAWLTSLLSILPLLLFMGLVWVCKFRHMAKLTLLVMCLVMAVAWALLASGWWWPPLAALCSVIIACVLISWRCQATALQWFQQEIDRLEQEPSLIPEPEPAQQAEWGLVLHQRLLSLERAITRIHDTRQFIADSIDSMPIATLVVDVQGRIILPSHQGRRLLQQHHVNAGGNVKDLLARMTAEGPAFAQQAPSEDDELAALEDTLYTSQDERHYHLKVSSLVTAVDAFEVGWLIGFVDVTSERQAEEQRASLLRFLSHDLKAPQSSILALTQLQQSPESRVTEEVLLERVAQQARNALSLTDSFMQLTRIEFGAMERDFLLLSDVVLEAIDQAWPKARQHGIRIDSDVEDEGPMEGDRAYLLRAIYNLIDNALKYSPADTTVSITVRETSDHLSIEIQDQGVGIPPEDLPTIFDSYQRSTGADLSAGYGLGLALVKSVIERHGGTIECDSTENVGTCFRLRFTARPELLAESPA